MAPEYPSAINTILLHTGQPTARNEINAPAVPIFIEVSSTLAESFFTYVPKSIPERSDVIRTTGTDQLVTTISRPKIGFAKTAVGMEITSPVTIVLIITALHRRKLQVRRIIKYLFKTLT